MAYQNTNALIFGCFSPKSIGPIQYSDRKVECCGKNIGLKPSSTSAINQLCGSGETLNLPGICFLIYKLKGCNFRSVGPRPS